MDNQENEELRTCERYYFREDIYIDGSRCACTDISESGVYVAAQYFAVGNIVDVTLPFKGADLTIKGQVQHCEEGFGAGINFIDLSDDDRAMLKQLILSINNASASVPTEHFRSSSQTPLSMLDQNVILEALLTLLNRKQIINEKELLYEVKKKTGEKESEMTIALNR